MRAIREQIAASVHVIVQQSRLSDGSRKVTAISEIVGIDRRADEIELRPIFEFVRTGTGPKRQGRSASSARPATCRRSSTTFIVMGLVKPGEPTCERERRSKNLALAHRRRLGWSSLGVIALRALHRHVADGGRPRRASRTATGRATRGSLERKLRSMFIFTPGGSSRYGQLAAMFARRAPRTLTLDLPMWWAIILLIVDRPVDLHRVRCGASASSRSRTSSTTSSSRSRTR